ncbi:MAG: nitroreductase family protein [Oceanicoccus sp.]
MRKLIIFLLGEGNLHKIRHWLNNFDYLMLSWARKNFFLAQVYYLTRKEFRRETMAVLNGRHKYEKSIRNGSVASNSFLLRRNIHRIEKGIIMRPRRHEFGLDYIEDTLCAYAALLNHAQAKYDELLWADSVLKEFFFVTQQSTGLIEYAVKFTALSKRFNEQDHTPPAEDDKPTMIPYSKKYAESSHIQPEELHSLFLQRRAVRWYIDKPVEKSLVEKAAGMASLAPSACNRQPYEFYYIENSEFAAEVASIPMGTTGFSHQIRNLVVVVGDLSAYPAERDRHLIYIDGSLAAMQFMLALESFELSSCPINWPDVEKLEKKMEKTLNLPPYKRPVMLISIGYADPDGGIPYSQKKDILREIHAANH